MVAYFCALDQLPSPCTYARAAEVKPEHKKTSPSTAKKMQTKTNTMNCSFLESALCEELYGRVVSAIFLLSCPFALELSCLRGPEQGIVRIMPGDPPAPFREKHGMSPPLLIFMDLDLDIKEVTFTWKYNRQHAFQYGTAE